MPKRKRKKGTKSVTQMEKLQSTLSSLVKNFCDTPERFFKTDEEDASTLLKTTKILYDAIKTTEKQTGKSFSSLPELYTDNLDSEQIWEELQLQNSPTLNYLNEMCGRLEKYEPASSSEEEEEDEDSMQSSNDDDNDDDEEDEDGDVKFTGLQDSSDEDGDDSENENENDGDDKDADTSVLTDEQRKRILARKIAENAMLEDEEDEGEQTLGDESMNPDDFFNAADFEAFADGHEDMGNLMNVVVDEYDQLQEMESEDDEEDGSISSKGRKNKEDADMEEYRVDKEDQTMDSVQEPSYQDFFDPVRQGKSKKKKKEEEEENDEDNFDSSEDEDDEGDKDESSTSSRKRNEGMGSEDDDEDENENGESGSEEEEEELSRHERYQIEMKQKIKDLEEENLKRRSWELQGEVGAGQRPKGSLMEAEMDYQRNTKAAPVITPDVTATLEDMIKERIKEELWDDVERKSVDDYSRSGKSKELKEVSTEKSKIGLGEIYAQEFEQRYLGAAAAGEEEVNKKEKEIFLLWKKLSTHLDSLTNFHFTPKPKFDEMEIRKNVSSIQMEEVIPMGISTEAAAAPEEIMRKKKGREGVLIGEEESTPEERQRARRAKKAARRKNRQMKLADEKAVARANPGMGNKYAMKKALDNLSQARNVTQANNIDNDVKWTKSADVFKKLQDEVRSGIKGEKYDGSSKGKKRRKTGSSGNGYKL